MKKADKLNCARYTLPIFQLEIQWGKKPIKQPGFIQSFLREESTLRDKNKLIDMFYEFST